jgi:hypothetical protein
LACQLTAARCRAECIASHLAEAESDGFDFEARCPVCGRGGFRISEPRSPRLRHVWTCAANRCPAGAIRGALLRSGIGVGCLGGYDGANAKEVPADVARAMDRAISDILNCPKLKLQEVRLLLAEAQGRKFPDDYTEFVRFAKGIGLAHQQAYEAARRESATARIAKLARCWHSRPGPGRRSPRG